MADRLVVLYDAGCGLCTSLAGRLDGLNGIEVAPIQSDLGAHLLRDLTPAQRLDAVHAVDALGRRASGGAAVAAVAHRVPAGRLLGPLLDSFPAVTERGYRLVASHRRLLSVLLRRSGHTLGRRC